MPHLCKWNSLMMIVSISLLSSPDAIRGLDQKTYFVKVCRSAQKPWTDTFSDPVCNFGAPSGHFGLCKRCGGAEVQRCSGEQVPPAPLGWYFDLLLLETDLLT